MLNDKLDFVKVGANVSISVNNATDLIYVPLRNLSLRYNTTGNLVSVSFITNEGSYAVYGYVNVAQANITINGVAITSKPVFDSLIASLSPDGNSNSDTGSLATLAAAPVGGNSADQTNLSGKGVVIVVDVTAIAGTTPSLIVTIQGKDTASGKYYNILASAAITTVSTTVLTVYPGVLTAANVAAAMPLSKTWRVLYTIAGTTPAITATIGASVIV